MRVVKVKQSEQSEWVEWSVNVWHLKRKMINKQSYTVLDND